MRANDRAAGEIRPIVFVPGYVRNVPGSVLCEQGHTRVVATATVEDRVPPFLKRSGRGWITAEYAMLPGSSGNQRIARERSKINNRSGEIQRFIGRALRTVLDPAGPGRKDDHPGRRRHPGRRQHPLRLAQRLFPGPGPGAEAPGLRAGDRRFSRPASHRRRLGRRQGRRAAGRPGLRGGFAHRQRHQHRLDRRRRAGRGAILLRGGSAAPELFQKAIALGVEKNDEIIALQKKAIAAAGIPL